MQRSVLWTDIKIREGGKVVDKIKKIVFGSPIIDEIETFTKKLYGDEDI